MDENSRKALKVRYNSKVYIGVYKMEENKDNFDLFFRRKPAMMLLALRRMNKAKYGSVLAKEVDCTYSHAVKILQILEEMELVVFEKKGRIKIIKLTKRGIQIADNIEKIKEIIETR